MHQTNLIKQAHLMAYLRLSLKSISLMFWGGQVDCLSDYRSLGSDCRKNSPSPNYNAHQLSIEFEPKGSRRVIPWNQQLPAMITRWITGRLRCQFWYSQRVLPCTRALWVTKQAFIVLEFFTIHHDSCKISSVFLWKSLRLQPFLG